MKNIISRIPIKGLCMFDEPLSKHTTFRIGGPAQALCHPQDLNDLKALLLFASDAGLDIYIIGNGSNLLVSDKGVRGIVIKLNSPYFSRIFRYENNSTIIEAGCGVSVAFLLRYLQKAGLSGAEQLAGLPGSLGGAIAMNAQNIGECVENICGISLDSAMHIINKDRLTFGYRSFKTNTKDLIILTARLKLKTNSPQAVKERAREFLSRRRKTQELKLPSAGCVFRNPDSAAAGELIERAGLKGRRIGNAAVSQKHANFIVNLGSATASDVLGLMELVTKTVRQKSNILLEPEIKII